ncbi:MAG: cytochrome C oxidase subunit IV family protein [Paludisphaera borealis]|uniref:cytochrome C oxidase subunit IV family protein n=1 Tax=Paludisphaera borealis TaxID=1387353 RepID=UPI00283DBCA5|nr:cytochrome C oxidase subunit IV family protein [Paludisphaera borealis]MDR3621385.1 cytochrome C oxidase subunit IV family protein [Paludisphaera borealis]
MSDQAAAISPSEAAELEVESHTPYLKVWFGLLVFTLVEYFYARIFKDHFTFLMLGLLFLAIVKACMVGWYFMHLKFEKPWVYFMIVPALVFAAILTLALCPDMVLKYDEAEDEANEPQTTTAQLIGERPSFAVATVVNPD